MNKNILFKTLLMITLLGSIFSLNGQTAKLKNVENLTDNEVIEFFQKAKNSGMSETEIEKLAISQGYSRSDIQKMRERMTKLDLTNNTINNNKNNKTKSSIETTLRNNAAQTELKDLKQHQQNTEDEITDTTETQKKPIEIFGSNLFNNKQLSFEPNLRIATPKNYILGPDDEINIDVFGDVLDNYKVTVSPEGTIKILNLSPIYVNGMSIDEASTRIVSRMRQLYQGLNKPGSGSSAVITLGNVRSIKVTIVGEAKLPGTYTISSLATVFNALYQAGGPSENGSMRGIKVIRNGKVIRVLDVYDFLLRGDQKDNIQLHDQDVIRISEYETRVSVLGEVKRPMKFEILKNETLHDVLRFAGGFTEKAYTYSIQVTRNTSRELKLLNVTQNEVANFLPNNGDVFKIGAILERYENRVKVLGAVFRPGEYAIENGLTTVKELVKKAEGLRENAFLNRAILMRKSENFNPEVLSLDIGKIVRGELPDVPLKREDVLTIYFQKELKENQEITIDGQVNKPGKLDYYEGMKLADAILMASGLKEGASFNKIEIARRHINPNATNDNEGKTIEIITIKINGDLTLSDEGSQFFLNPFDKISIKASPTFENQRVVYIKGQVNYPGPYTLVKSNKLSDLLEKAGGLKSDSYVGGAMLIRKNIIVGVNIPKALINVNSDENISMIEGDTLFIPRNNETVKVSGAVQNPVYLSFNELKSMRNYVTEAGGYTDDAIKKSTYVKYANGKSNRIHSFLFFKKYPKMEPGAEIIVPAYPADRKKGLTTGEIITLSSSITTVSIALISLLRLL